MRPSSIRLADRRTALLVLALVLGLGTLALLPGRRGRGPSCVAQPSAEALAGRARAAIGEGEGEELEAPLEPLRDDAPEEPGVPVRKHAPQDVPPAPEEPPGPAQPSAAAGSEPASSTPPPARRLEVELSARTDGLEDLQPGGGFGSAVVELDDLDGDGWRELAVGAPGEDEGRGAVYVLFLDEGERVKRLARIAASTGALPPAAAFGEQLGATLAAAGDLDGDGRAELVVTEQIEDEADPLHPAAVHVLFLREDGSVRAWRELQPLELFWSSGVAPDGPIVLGGVAPSSLRDPRLLLGAPLDRRIHASVYGAGEGSGFLTLVDLSGRGPQIGFPPIHGPQDPSPSREHGRALLLADLGRGLEPVFGFQEDGRGWIGLHASPLRFPRREEPEDPGLGTSLAWLGDQDGDGTLELACGLSTKESEGGFWIVSFPPDARRDPALEITGTRFVAARRGGFRGKLRRGDRFGAALAGIADRDGDGVLDLAVGAPGNDDGGEDTGALWLLGLAP